MASEILFLGNAPAQAAPIQGGQAKVRAAGAEGAFQALMSLALSAFFGGGPRNDAPAVDGNMMEETAAPGVAQVALAGAEVQAQWPAQVGVVPVPVQKESGTGESHGAGAQLKVTVPAVAGPVDAASQAVETGGYVEAMTVAAKALTAPKAAPAAQLPGVGPAERQAGSPSDEGTLPACEASVRLTTEVATAPVYRQRPEAVARTESPAVAPETRSTPRVTGDAVIPQADAASKAMAASGDQPVDVGRQVAESGPVGHVATSATAPVKATMAGRAGAEASQEGLSGEAGEGTERAAEATRPSKQVKVALAEEQPVTEAAAPDVKVNVAQAVSGPVPATSSREEAQVVVDHPVRNVREMSETLYEESLRRLPRSVEIRIDPPQMGSVTALLSQRGQDVTVKFVTHSGQAQRVLEGATEDLARALSEKGLVLTGFSVDPGYSERSGQERRGDAGKPSPGRYHRVARLNALSVGTDVRQASGAFNWLA